MLDDLAVLVSLRCVCCKNKLGGFVKPRDSRYNHLFVMLAEAALCCGQVVHSKGGLSRIQSFRVCGKILSRVFRGSNPFRYNDWPGKFYLVDETFCTAGFRFCTSIRRHHDRLRCPLGRFVCTGKCSLVVHGSIGAATLRRLTNPPPPADLKEKVV